MNIVCVVSSRGLECNQADCLPVNSTGQKTTPTEGIPDSWMADVLNALATNGLPFIGFPSQTTVTV